MSTPVAEKVDWARVAWRRGHRSGTFVVVRADDDADVLAESPRFRWRTGGDLPPETAETSSCLGAVTSAVAAAGWETVAEGDGEWCALRFRKSLVPLRHRLQAYGVAPDEHLVTWLTEQTTPAPGDRFFGDEATRLDALRLAAARREAKRLEAEQLEAERLDADRAAAERAEGQRLEAERQRVDQLEAERLERERVEAERRDRERLEAERIAAELSASALRSRVGAYAAAGSEQRDIRASFAKKPVPRRAGRRFGS
jgi:hypothetical protein